MTMVITHLIRLRGRVSQVLIGLFAELLPRYDLHVPVQLF